jgi:hypothetical protein
VVLQPTVLALDARYFQLFGLRHDLILCQYLFLTYARISLTFLPRFAAIDCGE